MIYAYGGILGLILALSIALYVEVEKVTASQNRYDTLVAQISVERKEAEVIQQKQELDFKTILGAKDASYQTTVTKFNTLIDSMRKQRTGTNSSVVPTASNSKSSIVPEGTKCFDVTELDAAERESEAEIEEILFECGKTINRQACAVNWINSLPKDNNVLFVK